MILKPDAITVETAGGKAAALAKLTGAGFDVPPFFSIPASAFSLQDGAPQPANGLDLDAALATLGSGPYAVRSSARAEDGAEHSHAGQFDTLLNVAAPDVLDAAAKVWASGLGDTVKTYSALKGGEAEPPAILVQRMVLAEKAGVAFSADPVSGLRDRVVISAIEGLGEALVSGEEDGENWVVGPDCLLETPDTTILTPEEATQIAALARKAEAHFRSPQDIEWAIADGKLHLLQSRPITTPLLDPPNPDQALIVFDNSNIVESYPGLVSPLTYSFATYVYSRVYRAFVALLGVRQDEIGKHADVFDNMLARIDGRVYYNLGNWYRALALLPGFSLNRAHMETMMGVDEPLPVELSSTIGPPPAKGLARLRASAGVARVAGGLLWSAIRLPTTRKRFYARLNAALDARDHETANLTDLAAEYRRIETYLLDRWDAPLVNDFLCMMAFGASRKLLQKWAGDAGLAFHNDVMIGQGDIVSAEPAQRIAAMGAIAREAGLTAETLPDHPEMAKEITAYLDRFGDRCTEELKLESIPLSDDPAPLHAAILAAAGRPPHVEEERTPDWNALIANPVKRRIARAVTTYAKSRVRDRENLRFERTRVFGRARRIFRAMGREFTRLGKLNNERDIFLLTREEILGAIEGAALSHDLKAIVTLRKAEEAANATRPEPAERILVRGAALTAASTEAPAPPDTSTQQSGTGCSAGTVTARARVIRNPRTESLEAGDILVARNTDPGWIAVFSNASAIVVERGSLLSHSAIVARELGIPCVVGLKRATDWIETGETITVNGETGEVTKIHD